MTKTLKKLTIKNTYRVTLNKTGDYYFFYVDIKKTDGWHSDFVRIYDKSDVMQHSKIINSIMSGTYAENRMVQQLKEVLA